MASSTGGGNTEPSSLMWPAPGIRGDLPHPAAPHRTEWFWLQAATTATRQFHSLNKWTGTRAWLNAATYSATAGAIYSCRKCHSKRRHHSYCRCHSYCRHRLCDSCHLAVLQTLKLKRSKKWKSSNLFALLLLLQKYSNKKEEGKLKKERSNFRKLLRCTLGTVLWRTQPTRHRPQNRRGRSLTSARSKWCHLPKPNHGYVSLLPFDVSLTLTPLLLSAWQAHEMLCMSTWAQVKRPRKSAWQHPSQQVPVNGHMIFYKAIKQ
jgi:hypothetical protein